MKTIHVDEATARNWWEWTRRNPFMVIENGTIRSFRAEDVEFFKPGRYPGLELPEVPMPVGGQA